MNMLSITVPINPYTSSAVFVSMEPGAYAWPSWLLGLKLGVEIAGIYLK